MDWVRKGARPVRTRAGGWGSPQRGNHELRGSHSVFTQLGGVSIPMGAARFNCSPENEDEVNEPVNMGTSATRRRPGGYGRPRGTHTPDASRHTLPTHLGIPPGTFRPTFPAHSGPPSRRLLPARADTAVPGGHLLPTGHCRRSQLRTGCPVSAASAAASPATAARRPAAAGGTPAPAGRTTPVTADGATPGPPTALGALLLGTVLLQRRRAADGLRTPPVTSDTPDHRLHRYRDHHEHDERDHQTCHGPHRPSLPPKRGPRAFAWPTPLLTGFLRSLRFLRFLRDRDVPPRPRAQSRIEQLQRFEPDSHTGPAPHTHHRASTDSRSTAVPNTSALLQNEKRTSQAGASAPT